MAFSTGSIPPAKRIMMFIDGENLVSRYQDLLKQGRIQSPDVRHGENVFVWHPMTYSPGPDHIIRAYYYSAVVGDQMLLDKFIEDIKAQDFAQNTYANLTNTLFPKLFKKGKGMRSKGVDIQLTTDLLQHTYRDNFDVACIFTGDADFLPVIEEVMRAGKTVCLGAFSSGLSPQLVMKVDRFIDLDKIYFHAKKEEANS